MKYLLSILSLALPLWAVSGLISSEIEFKNGKEFFRVAKSTTRFTFIDNSGSRTLEIKDCNERQINEFWRNLAHNAETGLKKGSSNKKTKNSEASIQYDRSRATLAARHPSLNYFKRVPQASLALFAETAKACR